jgi:DNA-binding NarL/FixJ family response regulator
MKPSQAGALPNFESIRAAIYEERRFTREALARMLEPHPDIEVTATVDSLRRMRAELARAVPDVVVTGVAHVRSLMELLSQSAEPDQSPVVAYSTDDVEDQPAMFDALAAGANALLTQRAGSEQLAAAVRAVAGGEALLDSRFARRLLDAYRRQRYALPRPADQEALEDLTPREREILILVSSGEPNESIARRLFISLATVRTHVYRLCRKLDVRDRAHLVAVTYRSGLIMHLDSENLPRSSSPVTG